MRFTRFDGRFPEQNAQAFRRYLGKPVWEVGLESETDWEDQKRIQERRLPFRDFVHSRLLRDGTRRYFTASGDPVFGADGRFLGYRGVGRDITEQKRARDRIQHLATHDALTGLPNRAMVGALIEQGLHSAKRYERSLAILFVDLDGFKAVNDRLGHEAGDEVLRTVAGRFRDALRASDVVARWGGDEFVVLAQEVGDGENVVGVARKLLSAAVAPIAVAANECRISASIGIALFPEHGDSAGTLLKRADTAMYEAKRSGKNALRFHS
jgi:diguanylate cyclase (GGDEF)-like protein